MKHTPKIILEYPKLLAFVLMSALAYMLFLLGTFDRIAVLLNGHGYVSMLFGGLLFSFGFTTPFAIVLFITLADSVHPLIAAPIAAFGSLIADLTIFRFARLTLYDEIHRLSATHTMQKVIALFHHETISQEIRKYLFWSMAGVIIASPLPDEVGVTMLGSVTDIDERKLAVLCFVMNMVGVAAILSVAHS